MRILSAKQIREADSYTISHGPVTSTELMESAALACVDWIINNFSIVNTFRIFCGTGNNGGDGLAIARLLNAKGFTVSVFIIESPNASPYFIDNKKRLLSAEISFVSIQTENDLPEINNDDIIIDAIFGTGISRAAEGLYASVITYLNKQGKIISIDMPSGLFADISSGDNPVIHASTTLTFEVMKLAFLFPENAAYTGEVIVLPIELDKQFIEACETDYFITEAEEIHNFL